jgi:hypothetical protein
MAGAPVELGLGRRLRPGAGLGDKWRSGGGRRRVWGRARQLPCFLNPGGRSPTQLSLVRIWCAASRVPCWELGSCLRVAPASELRSLRAGKDIGLVLARVRSVLRVPQAHLKQGGLLLEVAGPGPAGK